MVHVEEEIGITYLNSHTHYVRWCPISVLKIRSGRMVYYSMVVDFNEEVVVLFNSLSKGFSAHSACDARSPSR